MGIRSTENKQNCYIARCHFDNWEPSNTPFLVPVKSVWSFTDCILVTLNINDDNDNDVLIIYYVYGTGKLLIENELFLLYYLIKLCRVNTFWESIVSHLFYFSPCRPFLLGRGWSTLKWAPFLWECTHMLPPSSAGLPVSSPNCQYRGPSHQILNSNILCFGIFQSYAKT